MRSKSRRSGTSDYAGLVFAEYIANQLTEERSRKSSLEQRGTTIITTAGTLSTFLFGLAAFSRSPTTAFRLSTADEAALISALALLLVAAILGLFTNRLLDYREPSLDYLQELTHDDDDHWNWPDVATARRQLAEGNVEQLKIARELNDRKASALQWALTIEILAILSLAVAVGLTLFKA